MANIDEISHDDTSHRWRLAKLLPALIDEFGETREPEVIRGCADRVLDHYDAVPIRSHILTLAHRAGVSRCGLSHLGFRQFRNSGAHRAQLDLL